ncbi:MAG: HEPN domain-containing protein [Bacteroidaceae bacterium]|nr:HEPN domain-containing protein [Bacteroidaceae bacterium]
MGLSEEDRKTMVRLEMERAHKFMKQAEMVCELEQWDIAANRYYYACFHAVQALFIHNGLASRRHSGMLTQLGLHFIKTGIIEDRLGAFLTRMEQLREKGDYNCLFDVTKDELLTFVEPAQELVRVIEQLIG